MAGVVGNTGLGLDHFTDTAQRPHVGGVPTGERTLLELTLDAPQVCPVEPRQATRTPRAAQRGRSAGTPLGKPAAHTLPRDLELACDVGLAVTSTKQRSRLFAATLHRIEVTWGAGSDGRHDEQQQDT